jgi:hypothetical protein
MKIVCLYFDFEVQPFQYNESLILHDGEYSFYFMNFKLIAALFDDESVNYYQCLLNESLDFATLYFHY